MTDDSIEELEERLAEHRRKRDYQEEAYQRFKGMRKNADSEEAYHRYMSMERYAHNEASGHAQARDAIGRKIQEKKHEGGEEPPHPAPPMETAEGQHRARLRNAERDSGWR